MAYSKLNDSVFSNRPFFTCAHLSHLTILLGLLIPFLVALRHFEQLAIDGFSKIELLDGLNEEHVFGDRAHEESASKEHDFHETTKVSKKVECSVDFPLVVHLIGSELEKEVSVEPPWWVNGVIRGYVDWFERSVVIKFEVFCLTKLKVLVLRFNLVDPNPENSAGDSFMIDLEGSGPLYGFSRGFIAILCEIKRILNY